MSQDAVEARVIEVENLTKRFGETTAVDDLSFQVNTGEILGLLGPNGAGKTTTIQLLLGLTTPTSGRIRIFGQDLQKHRLAILQRVNFSSAYVSLPSNLTVWENLNIFARLYGVRSPRARIESLLELFGISHAVRRVTGALSSGQITRLNLCKALLSDPEVLFLDEPTASLDPEIADKVRTILLQIHRERRVSIIYTSHNMRDIEIMCDRVIFISRGRIITEGTTEEVLAHAQSQSLEEMFITIARNGELKGAREAEEE